MYCTVLYYTNGAIIWCCGQWVSNVEKTLNQEPTTQSQEALRGLEPGRPEGRKARYFGVYAYVCI